MSDLKEEDFLIKVMDSDRTFRELDSEEFRRYLAFKRDMEEDDSEGSVSFTLPRKVGWNVIGLTVTVLIQLLIGGTILYNTQQSFNEKVEDKISSLEEEIEIIKNSTYTRKEEDLRFENLRLEIMKHREILDLLKEDIKRGTE